jgi:hypothetical protein
MTWRCVPLPTPDLELAGFACTHLGSCWDCGGSVDAATPGGIDGRFCTPACADSYAANLTAMEQVTQRRRDLEDAFGAACDLLRSRGWDDPAIDQALAGLPT